MTYLRTLRLFFSRGVFNDYRLQENHVEFRTQQDTWRILSDSEIELHYRFNTELARCHRCLSVPWLPYFTRSPDCVCPKLVELHLAAIAV
jgi:hypothetical protein